VCSSDLGSVENLEMAFRTKNGAKKYGLFNSVLMSLGNEKYLLTVVTDITDRKQAEEALKKNEEMLSLITENMSDMIRVTDLQGVNLYASPSHLAGLGYRPEERLGKTGFDIAHSDDLPMLINEFAKGLAGTEPMKRVEYRVKHADGHYIWLDTIVNILRDDQGQVKTIVMCSRDISERKQAEFQREAALEALAKSEERYRTITENMMDCIVLEDAKGIFQYVINCREILGYEPEEMIGKTGLSFCHPDERTREINLYQGALGKEWQEIIYETRIRHKKGHFMPIEVNTRALRDEQGEFIGAVIAARDAANHRRIVKELFSTTNQSSANHILSQREKEILGWVMQGKSTWDIATILDISERTIKYHIDNTMKKLSAVNRTHAVAIALRDDLI
jgi:PAS domain S-box-containing protein